MQILMLIKNKLIQLGGIFSPFLTGFLVGYCWDIIVDFEYWRSVLVLIVGVLIGIIIGILYMLKKAVNPAIKDHNKLKNNIIIDNTK